MIELDKELIWNYGLRVPGEELYKPDTDLYRIHSSTGHFKIRISSDGAVEGSDILVASNKALESHGWWLWSLWFPVGLLLVVTKRWLAGKAWAFNQCLHALLGHSVTGLTLYQAYIQLERFGWEIDGLHSWLGTLFCLITVLADFSGSATAGVGRFCKDEPWKEKERYAYVAKVHRIASKIVIFVANAILMTGLARYENYYLKRQMILAPLSMASFCLIVFLCELAHRVMRRKHQVLKVPQALKNKQIAPDSGSKYKVYSPIAFRQACSDGEPLMILDNLVLNINKTPIPLVDYIHMHPGGRFTLEKNYGRDISKFFYGGYRLVNPGMHKVKHSNNALSIAESLVVGVIEDQAEIQEQPMVIMRQSKVNKDSATFIFAHKDGFQVPNFKKWYFDLGMIGRHFLVFEESAPRKKRQYTICNTMRPEIYKALLSLDHSVNSTENIDALIALLDDADSPEICLTLKNYMKPKGLSTKIHV